MITQKLLNEFREYYVAGKMDADKLHWWNKKFYKIPFNLFKKILEEEHDKKNQERWAEGDKEATKRETT